jgi:hypothetical protein
MKRPRFGKILFLVLIIAPLAIFIVGSIVMLLWNNTLVPVLGVQTVSFWQALGILVLSKILFSSFSGGNRHRRGNWKQRMMWGSMTDEQRQQFREEWKKRNPQWGYPDWNKGTGPVPGDAGA